MPPAPTFEEELQDLINRHSLEYESSMPDVILAEFLNNCLAVFNNAIQAADKWYGSERIPGLSIASPQPQTPPNEEGN